MTALTKDQFLPDVNDHVMTVIRDDGLYRHLRFKKPRSSCMHFDLLTYPGGLLYRGDMGAFAFERLEDMFEFFRTDRGSINPYYWAQKLIAVDRNSQHPVKEFSEEEFDREIKLIVLRWVRYNSHRTDREQRRDLWDAVMDEVIGADSDIGGDRKQIAANDFFHDVKPGLQFHFEDIWDHDFTEWTHGYLWCCFALVWGIAKYDELKAKEKASEPAAVEGGAA